MSKRYQVVSGGWFTGTWRWPGRRVAWPKNARDTGTSEEQLEIFLLNRPHTHKCRECGRPAVYVVNKGLPYCGIHLPRLRLTDDEVQYLHDKERGGGA